MENQAWNPPSELLPDTASFAPTVPFPMPPPPSFSPPPSPLSSPSKPRPSPRSPPPVPPAPLTPKIGRLPSFWQETSGVVLPRPCVREETPEEAEERERREATRAPSLYSLFRELIVTSCFTPESAVKPLHEASPEAKHLQEQLEASILRWKKRKGEKDARASPTKRRAKKSKEARAK